MSAQPVNVLAVPALLSFDRLNLNSRGQPGFKLGTGEAGYTVYRFTDPQQALDFALRVPPQSRMPCHERAVADIRRAIARTETAV